MRRMSMALGVIMLWIPFTASAQSPHDSELCHSHLMVVSQARSSMEQNLARLIVAQEQLQAKVKELEENLAKTKDGHK